MIIIITIIILLYEWTMFDKIIKPHIISELAFCPYISIFSKEV